MRRAGRIRFVLLGALLVPSAAGAQNGADGWGWGWRRAPPRFPTAEIRQSRFFTFTRVLYQSVWREWMGHGWDTDYPDADANFMRRFSELTTGAVNTDRTGDFNHVVVQLTDDLLFEYPFIFLSDAGTAGFTTEDVEQLRAYLLKGGILYADDFWGDRAWEHWTHEIAKVLPPGEYPVFDMPPDHAVFHALFDVRRVPQIPSIQFWRRSGGAASERGAESAQPHFRGIADRAGRLMVIMSHNTDIADGWEREGEEYEFFHRFSPDAYALAINIVIYAMTH